MILYFLRHGLAGDRDAWAGDDFGRPLTDEGKERMAREAATIAKLDLNLDFILTSPLVRAYQTAEIVTQHLNLTDKLVKDERLAPGFGSNQLAEILKLHPEAQVLMLVGHEPDFSQVIGDLIGGGSVECKKGSLARVDLPNPLSRQGDLVWLIPPKVLAL
jgi:phosphohistidine phosphatase